MWKGDRVLPKKTTKQSEEVTTLFKIKEQKYYLGAKRRRGENSLRNAKTRTSNRFVTFKIKPP